MVTMTLEQQFQSHPEVVDTPLGSDETVSRRTGRTGAC